MRRLILHVILMGLMLPMISCTRGKGDSSTVRIQFDNVSLSQNSEISGKVVALSGDSPEWNQTLNPSAISEINCYAIFVGGGEALMKASRCYNSSTGATKFQFGPHLYFVPVGSAISLTVPSGPLRNIVIAGLKTQSGACRLDSIKDDEPDFANMSVPFILAEKKVDLAPGEVSLTIDAKLDLNNYFDDCDFARDHGGDSQPGPLQITGSYPHQFGLQANGSVTSHTLTVTNVGVNTVTAMADPSSLAPPYQFKGGSFPGTGGTCAATLAGSASCTIVVDYSPTASAVYNDEIEINYLADNIALVSRMALVGSSDLPAQLMFTPGPSFDFGNVTVGNSPSQVFTVMNTGGVDATAVTQVGLSTPYTLMGGTCTSLIPAGGSCVTSVMFSPGSISSFPATLQLMYHNGVTSSVIQNLNINGTGI